VEKTPVYADPTETEGIVYFYREKEWAGSGVRYAVHEGDTKLGALKSGTYSFHLTEPGEKRFWAETESEDSAEFSVEANEAYYIKCEVGMGLFVGRPKLTVVSDVEGEPAVKKLKYVKFEPEIESAEK